MAHFLIIIAFTLASSLHSALSLSSTPPNGGMPYGGGTSSYIPWAPNNLAPFEAYWNGNLCFSFNQSTACPPNYLNQTGKLYLSTPEAQADFCAPQCLNGQFNQTMECIYKVTKYNQTVTWKFINGATVYQLVASAEAACSQLAAGQPANFTYVKPS